MERQSRPLLPAIVSFKYSNQFTAQSRLLFKKLLLSYVDFIIKLYRTAFKFCFHAKGTGFAPRRPFKSLRVFDNKGL